MIIAVLNLSNDPTDVTTVPCKANTEDEARDEVRAMMVLEYDIPDALADKVLNIAKFVTVNNVPNM